jgi:hypothetical protein
MKWHPFNNLKKENKEKLPKALQKALLPNEKFIDTGKKHFLAAFDTSPLAAQSANASENSKAPSSAFAWGLKFGIGVLAVFAIVAGTSAYADTANVSAENPLYPLKRLGENVQLALTPSQEKAQVQATFAARRAAEIDELQKNHPSSKLIASLVKDLNNDVSSSLTVASNSQLRADSLATFCETFSGRLQIALALHPELLARFNAKCGSDVASTTIITSSTINTDLGTSSSSLFDARRADRLIKLQNIINNLNSSGTASTTIQTSSTLPLPPPATLPKLPL